MVRYLAKFGSRAIGFGMGVHTTGEMATGELHFQTVIGGLAIGKKEKMDIIGNPVNRLDNF